MGTLLLNSLEIRNFRGFGHLQIEHLGRVNLIVGKNNVGKTSLLEALYLYANRGSPRLIREILDARDEGNLPISNFENLFLEALLPGLKYLFYGRKEIKTTVESFQIGPINSSNETLSITVGAFSAYNTVDEQGPRLSIRAGNQHVNYSLGTSMSSTLAMLGLEGGIKCAYISENGLDREQLGELWDGIALTSLEKDVQASLRIIAPGVEGLNFVGDPPSIQISPRGSSATTRGRIPIVKIADINEPLPLRSLGNGMQHVLGIALALPNARDGLLLIDEIENGIHYSVQPELWQLIFQLAHRLNVQVLATTHSWDSIEGFQKAAQENDQGDAMLIRLGIKKDEIIATLFDKRGLEIATREQIEVR